MPDEPYQDGVPERADKHTDGEETSGEETDGKGTAADETTVVEHTCGR